MPLPANTSDGDQVPDLKMAGISKAFGHIQALDRVDLELYCGQVVALLGDNGAGKSTLIKILSGVYQADAGAIYVDGRPAEIRSPMDAQNIGIATVFQDLTLVPNRDVASNIYLGREPTRLGIFLDRRKMYADSQAVLGALCIKLPSVRVNTVDLSGGQRQAVAIARAVARGGRFIIMDEPTAALGVEQTRMVHALIADLRAQGHAVLIITHNMAHVFVIADRMVVLRHGKRVGACRKTETSPEELVGLMTGAISTKVQ